MTLPARLHFCWIGPGLAWAHAFAVLSAAAHSGLNEIVLHHTDALADNEVLHALRTTPRIRLSPLDPVAYLTEVGELIGAGAGLAALHDSLDTPVMRADLLRAAILYREGGIYLDLDTITVAALTPLTAHDAFVGSEYIVWPNRVRRSRSPLLRGRALGLDLLRKLLRFLPDGWRLFGHVKHWYFRSVTNAAMGSAPQGRFLATYLRAMLDLHARDRAARCALGPHLLQAVIETYDGSELTILEPHVFHPLPPEISRHWFRMRRSVTLGAVLPAGTLVAHWYASVGGATPIGQITPDYVLRHRDRQFYSALVHAYAGPHVALGGA